MRSLLLSTIFLLAGLVVVRAQPICTPDSMAIDTFISGFGVNPLPYDEVEFPQGGFQDTVCFGDYFETVIQVAVADTAMVAGNQIVLDSVVLSDIENLPAGLTYVCSTPDCIVYPNTNICATIYGTPTDTDDIGDNVLQIAATVYTSGFVLAVNYPDPALNQVGAYNLVVKSAADCTTDVRALTGVDRLRVTPNPFARRTQLAFDSQRPGRMQLRVSDAFGRRVHTRTVDVQAGPNRVDLDAGDWAEGVYLYTLEHDGALVSGRLVVTR